MIKQIRASYSNNKKNAQYCALSTDELPNYFKNGDEVYFIDTGKCYTYNEQTGELVEGTLSGGGGKSVEPYNSDPSMNGVASAGSSTNYARGDHVHPSDTSRIAANQGIANAGKFLIVGSDGIVVPTTLESWQGGSY